MAHVAPSLYHDLEEHCHAWYTAHVIQLACQQHSNGTNSSTHVNHGGYNLLKVVPLCLFCLCPGCSRLWHHLLIILPPVFFFFSPFSFVSLTREGWPEVCPCQQIPDYASKCAHGWLFVIYGEGEECLDHIGKFCACHKHRAEQHNKGDDYAKCSDGTLHSGHWIVCVKHGDLLVLGVV